MVVAVGPASLINNHNHLTKLCLSWIVVFYVTVYTSTCVCKLHVTLTARLHEVLGTLYENLRFSQRLVHQSLQIYGELT